MDTQIAEKLMPQVTHEVAELMSTMVKACQANKQTDFGAEVSERIRRFPFIISEVAKMAFWVGFDRTMTAKVPPFDKVQAMKPAAAGISDSMREILTHISVPVVDALSAMLAFYITKGVTSSKRSEKLRNKLAVSVFEMMTNSFGIGGIEATVKMKDIPLTEPD